MRYRKIVVAAAITVSLVHPHSAHAVEKCKTTLDCAQQAVDSAAQAAAAVAAMQARLDSLQSQVTVISESIGKGRVLGALAVNNGSVTYASAGVTFDGGSGTVTFPNQKKLPFVPVATYISENGVYATNDIFLRSAKTSDNSFIVWRGALDTGGRNWPPANFTVAIIGFEP